ncbi:heavy metal translocating P-type ATPase [Marinactinospora thermotolerans]|uniref:Heavy metal-(Cd/Co/Hg/Pb/Zn)-translocating P-type ATPase n=1 Tax=Marinactinospora thermotolerans DSM 45154 TaxID=1122192 RepID=A0A1T4NRS7_9ACTN|nr:heavy metal translocating P-type ATPase [Marinactinospora thermotolerans]SJZ81980.1 heavy metal-(Cd/Co/Hg/Pb/Zn)-translocating P-type ATPase [Marinactinospora thermotolerans DSM 45154]
MTQTRVPPAPRDRALARPPSILATGVRLPEVRWAAAALLLFLLGWGMQLAAAPAPLWWAAYLACYATGGWEPALAGLRALRDRTLDVDLLMIVAAIAAASIGQVFDGALLIVIFATSGALEAVVTQRTADSVDSLLNLAPEQATLLREDGTTATVASRDLTPGQRILVRPGERIGGDGTVVEGISEVDQQAITGESVPVVRGVGDEVLSGTVNGTGTLTVRITREAGASVIARIVALVEEASGTKARTQLFIERIEQAYSFGVVVATLLVLAVPMLFLGHAFEQALTRAIVFMIVASPCAVVLSTMPPLLASIANAGRHGVLVKSATVMETVGRTTVVAFDKTGTLTEGAPEVTEVGAAAGHTEDEVLALAAAVERYSEHPLGRAIARAAAERDLAVPEAVDFRALPGRGVTGRVGGRAVTVERADAASATTGTVVEVRREGEPVGTVTLVDRLRPDARAAVQAVAGLTTAPAMLLTGDHASAAAAVAERTGVTSVRSRLMPQDKVAVVEDLQSRGERVLLVGDGVNDAPALAAASTGVAMGRRGSDLALDTADVVIVRDELGAVANLVRLSRRARRYVIANLVIAASVIAVLVTWDLVATLPLALAVAGHEGSTVLVALNGARLLRRSAWQSG